VKPFGIVSLVMIRLSNKTLAKMIMINDFVWSSHSAQRLAASAFWGEMNSLCLI